jgi:hypothetical protein
VVYFLRRRVEAQEKMILLNEKAEKDIQQHNAEMKELVRVIDHDRKLREFMNTKTREREEDDQLVKWRAKKGLRCSRGIYHIFAVCVLGTCIYTLIV